MLNSTSPFPPYGPAFEVGDRVILDDSDYRPPGLGSSDDPFTIVTIYDNPYKHRCACGYGQGEPYRTHTSVHCGPRPRQWVNIKGTDGQILCNADGKPWKYASAWFQKIEPR